MSDPVHRWPAPPEQALPIETLLQVWMQEEIRLVCARPAELEDYPELAVRLRGALGAQLIDLPGPVSHRFDPFDRPPPYPFLYGDAAPQGFGRPMALDVDVIEDRVIIDLRLFGAAGIWLDQCREALLRLAEAGVALSANGRQRVPLAALECGTRRAVPPDPPPSVRAVQLHCLTPTLVRRERTIKGDAASLLYAAVTRAEGLAPWQGGRLRANVLDLRQRALEAKTLRDERVIYRWFRHSQRQRDVDIEMKGWLGTLSVAGRLTELAPYLLLAEATHLGSHAALGLGRVRVGLMP